MYRKLLNVIGLPFKCGQPHVFFHLAAFRTAAIIAKCEEQSGPNGVIPSRECYIRTREEEEEIARKKERKNHSNQDQFYFAHSIGIATTTNKDRIVH